MTGTATPRVDASGHESGEPFGERPPSFWPVVHQLWPLSPPAAPRYPAYGFSIRIALVAAAPNAASWVPMRDPSSSQEQVPVAALTCVSSTCRPVRSWRASSPTIQIFWAASTWQSPTGPSAFIVGGGTGNTNL